MNTSHQGWTRLVLRIALVSALARRIHCFCSPSKNQPTSCTRLFVKEEQPPSSTPIVEVQIRDCLYGEIGAVADVIMDSFYTTATPPWNHMYRLGEINRLQQGFPYADRDQHRMIVAVVKRLNGASGKLEEHIVGFCDCDQRTPNQSTYKWNPRPYISDLCVSPSVRRQGVANKLVEYCEEVCQKWGQTEAFIRVERVNVAALTLYQNLGYIEVESLLDDSEKIIVLRKALETP